MKAFGIINFEGKHVNVAGLSDYRPVPAFSFLGRYRLIDIMISNMTNSGIEYIQVYMNGETRSLIEHLGTGRHYNINSKTGRLQMLIKNPKDQGVYNHDVNAFLYNLEAIEEAIADYVVIAPSYIVYPVDFRLVIKEHQKSGADITVVYAPVNDAKEHYFECDCLDLDGQGRVTAIKSNYGKHKNRNISLETYVMSKKLFIDLITLANKTSSLYWLKDSIRDNLADLHVQGYRCLQSCYFICNLEDYYWANITIKDYRVASSLFHKNWRVYTRTNDTAPAYYGKEAKVKNSVVANGTVIHGSVENCVIGRQVKIERGAEVKDCVICPGAYIGKDVKISYAVVDKSARIEKIKNLGGKKDDILYIKRKDEI